MEDLELGRSDLVEQRGVLAVEGFDRVGRERRADATRRDYTGRTALMWADWNRKAAVTRLLRRAGVRE